ncbi:MAG: 23S rRNA (pseudouridine(1915)-N(3))-methyltransferase RlmH [Desulfovibrionaceae bacterium]|jgi:23S rRNA (pseudouridine1915-N3)-methyltransferase|nr:23S rRNA (pseudouridine(1915)-N(3))-methyltransferase RlmH [Desulfovibrionaceae bacterium]
MQKLKLVWVGKAKAAHWRAAEDHYAKLLSRWFKLERVEVKDAPGKLTTLERNAAEGARLLGAVGATDVAVALDAAGRSMTSERLAALLRSLSGDGNRVPCFVVGGAFGLSPEVLARADHTLSLSAMTFPHELARVVLLEQLYRAAAILRDTGYHH